MSRAGWTEAEIRATVAESGENPSEYALPIRRYQMSEIKGVQNTHQTMDTIASLMSAIGWVVVIVGAIAAVVAFSDGSGAVALAGAGYGLAMAVAGFMLVAQGQLITVIGKIELNTQRTYQLLAMSPEDAVVSRSDEVAKDMAMPLGEIDSKEFAEWKAQLIEERPAFVNWEDQVLYDKYYKSGSIRFDKKL